MTLQSKKIGCRFLKASCRKYYVPSRKGRHSFISGVSLVELSFPESWDTAEAGTLRNRNR